MKGAKKKRGRPPKPERERRSKTRTFRVRGILDLKLQRAAKSAGRSISEEIEWRLEQSFDLANTASLVRVLAGGGFTADLLGAIAKVFDLGGEWKKYPESSPAAQVRTEVGGEWKKYTPVAQVRTEAAYIALIIIFTELFSTPERPLEPAAAGAVIAAMRGRGGLEATPGQMEGAMMANSVLKKVEHTSLLQTHRPSTQTIPTDETVSDILRVPDFADRPRRPALSEAAWVAERKKDKTK